MEHCIFYAGELHKICESETFLPQGMKTAKDTNKKKHLSTGGGGSGSPSASHDGAQVQRHDNPGQSKQIKNSGSQIFGNFHGTGGGNHSSNGNQSIWGSRRSEASLWLLLINKLSKNSLLPVCMLKYSLWNIFHCSSL